MKSKLITLLLVLGLAIGGGTAGVIASSDDGGGGDKNAASSQYQPGKGCGTDEPRSGPPGNTDNTDCPPQSRTPKSTKASRKAACKKKHPDNRGKRKVCVKRANKRAKCRANHAAGSDARKKCMADARKIGKKKNNGKKKND